jgi:serine/threonine-protein kinase
MAAKFGACERVVYHLRRSNLLDRGRLDQVLGDFMKTDPELEPAGLANYLIRQGILTSFQAERVLQGKTENLVLGPYTVADAIGFGSMGTVYKARSKNDQQWYVLKLMPRRSMWNVRIAKRLARTFEKVRHPAVVRFVDVNTVGANLYLAWPYVEGESLEGLVRRKGRLLPGLGAWFALQTAEGLSACHRSGLIHGLLKPANLLVGPNQEIRILDFGIGALLSGSESAELVDTMSTANAVTSGLDCRSPENILDVKVRTPAGDQYSLGCILYFCLTGQYPFAGETAVEKMLAHQIKEPVPIRSLRPEVPQQLVDIVQRLMQKTPESRFSSMDEAIEALRPLAVTPEVAARLLALEVPDSPDLSASQANAPSEALAPAPLTPESIPSAVVIKSSADEDADASFAFPQTEPGDLPAPDSGKHALAGNKSGWVVVLVSAVCATLIAVLLWLVLHG